MSSFGIEVRKPGWSVVLALFAAWIACSAMLYGGEPYATLPRPAGSALLEETPRWSAADALRQLSGWSQAMRSDYVRFQLLDAGNALLLACACIAFWRAAWCRRRVPLALAVAGSAAAVLTLLAEWLESAVLASLSHLPWDSFQSALADFGGWVTLVKMAGFVGAMLLFLVGLLLALVRGARARGTGSDPRGQA